MFDLTPIFTIAGMTFATILTEYVMEKTGHGDKTVFVKVAGYGIVAFYSIRVWMDYVRRIGAVFGVFV